MADGRCDSFRASRQGDVSCAFPGIDELGGHFMAHDAKHDTVVSGATAATRAPVADDDSARRWLILGVVCLGQLMVVLDATVVNIALPTAQHDLAFSNADRQWVVTAYSLAFGGLLLLGGRLSDLAGRKRMLIIGMVGFAAASALGGAATGLGMLLAGRAIQGAFGAMLAPAALSTLTVTFTNPAERGKAFGVYGAIAGAGGAVGLLLGGILTEYLSWRWCLYINVVFALVGVAAALRLLHNQPRDSNVRLDLPGSVLVVAGLVAVVYGLSLAETDGWGAPLTIGLLVAGVILLAVFVAVEQRVAHPLLPLRIVLDRFRGGAYLAIGLSAVGLFAIFLFLTYFLQQSLGYSPVVTGLAFLPMIAALVASSTTSSGLLMPRLGPRILVPAGLLVAAGGLVILATQLGPDASYPAAILPALVVVGAGLGMVFGCALNTATYGAARADAGVASAMVNTCQQVGGSIGTALLNTIAASALTSYLTSHPHTPTVAASAAVHSYVVTFWVSAVIFAGAAVICGLVLRPGVLSSDDGEELALVAA
jgi:EmrB/QacA subfamily drug resistance transporter